MNWQRIWNDPVWSKVIAGIVLAAGAVSLTILAVNPLVVGTLASVILLGAVLLGWTLLRPPIAWNFPDILGMVADGADLRVISFQANGTNYSGKGIQNVQGHLVSGIDNSISEPLCFVIGGNRVLPSFTTGIPPGANFKVMIPLCDMDKGYDGYLSEYEFLQHWSAFRFVVELDGIRIEKNFSVRRVAHEIEKFRKTVNPSPKPQVRVKA